jgi:hypothetical protein
VVWGQRTETEALTNITDGHVPDAVYDAVRGHFSEKELADLTWAVSAINAWNRVAIAFRSEPARRTPGRTGERGWRIDSFRGRVRGLSVHLVPPPCPVTPLSKVALSTVAARAARWAPPPQGSQ